jgi:hypothetical protein
METAAMTSAVSRLDEVREALEVALFQQDWEAVGRLDLQCRSCIDDALTQFGQDDAALRQSLNKLLALYRLLIQDSTSKRNEIASEISQLRRGNQAAKVYQLFG